MMRPNHEFFCSVCVCVCVCACLRGCVGVYVETGRGGGGVRPDPPSSNSCQFLEGQTGHETKSGAEGARKRLLFHILPCVRLSHGPLILDH